MTAEQKRRASEAYTAWFERTHPRLAGEPAFAYYMRGIQCLGTPEGFAAFKDAARQATESA